MKQLFRNAALVNVSMAMVLAFASSASAQLAYDSEQYPFDFEQGGWVDEEAGLVWGYNVTCVNQILNWDFASAESYAAGYPNALLSAGNSNEAFGDQFQADGDAAFAAGDIEAADFWYALADFHYEKADALFAANVVAAGFEGWRLPTINEAEAAHAKGLFSFPRNPTLDLANCPRFDVRRWTSSGRGKRKYTIRPSTGEIQLILKTTRTGSVPLIVRSLNPGGDDGGNGNGNGNGKGKGKNK